MKWIVDRLRSMSFIEIIFRLKQTIQKYYEYVYLKNLPPKIPKVILNSIPISVFDLPEFKMKGEISIFGEKLSYIKNIDWQTDIFSNKKFPLKFSKFINIRSKNNISAKVIWEINRMQFLTVIAINYQLYKNPKDLVLFTNIILSWISQNPFLTGINWYSNIEVNIRLIVWFFCWNILNVNDLLNSNKEFRKFVQKDWLPCIYHHCYYSFHNPSKYSSSNNHLISEYSGLFLACTIWKFPDSNRWFNYAKKGLEEEIVRQHSPNGINKEEAAEYIQFITDFFLLPFIIGQKINSPFRKNYKDRLKQII